MEKVVLEAAAREVSTKSVNNTLRRSGRVPGVIYSREQAPLPFHVAVNSINPLVFTSVAHLVTLQLDGKEYDCILKDVQFDPVTDRVIHFDLQGLIAGEKIEIEIPILFTGTAVGVRDGGVLQQNLHKLTISCLPADIPEHIEVNVSELRLGQGVHVRDLKHTGFEFVHADEMVIVSVTHMRGAADSAAALPGEGPAEPEVISKGKEKAED